MTPFAREEHRALEDVRQLAHVAGERVGREHLDHLRSDARRGAAEALGVPGDEVPDEQRNVAASLAQRRHVHRHHLQAEEQVLAEAPAGTSVLRSRFVAATTRASTLMVSAAPTRRISPS